MRLFGLLLAALALASQLATASAPRLDARAENRIAALDALTVRCLGGKPDVPAHAPHRPAEPSLCPAAIAFAVPLAVLRDDPVLRPPRLVLSLRDGPAAAPRIAVAAVPDAAYPRGPPDLA